MYSIAIAVPGSAGKRDIKWYFNGTRYVQDTKNGVSNEHDQEKTLGVVLDASGIAKENQFIVQYPQNLNVMKAVKTLGNLPKATSAMKDSTYGRSVRAGVHELRALVETVARSVKFQPVNLLLVGYSQGSEVVQMYLSSIKKSNNPAVYEWLLYSLRRAVLLANPVRSLRYPVLDVALEVTSDGVKSIKPWYNGSLAGHAAVLPLRLDPQFASRAVNVFMVKDPIAHYNHIKEDTFSTAIDVIVGSLGVHTNYRPAKPVLEHLLSGFRSSGPGQVLVLKQPVSDASVFDGDSNSLYSLAKKYYVSRAGSRSYARECFIAESNGVKQSPMRGTISLVDDNYGSLGKVVQIAVWARVSDLILEGLIRNPYYHNIAEELLSYIQNTIMSPYELVDALLRETRLAIRGDYHAVGSSMGATIGALNLRDPSKGLPNSKLLSFLISQQMVEIPDEYHWLKTWDGNPHAVGVRTFLEDSVNSTIYR